jgi:hypothetical protein
MQDLDGLMSVYWYGSYKQAVTYAWHTSVSSKKPISLCRGHLPIKALPLISVPVLVRRAKLGFASQGQVLTPEALARHRVPSVASETVTSTAKRTQGGDGPQRASVKGLSSVMDVKCGCRRR